VKLYDQKHAEKISLTGLFPGEAEVSDLLWFTSLKLETNLMVACSPCEFDPSIVVLKQDGNNCNVIGKADTSVFKESGAP
jgi:hypothetical protein